MDFTRSLADSQAQLEQYRREAAEYRIAREVRRRRRAAKRGIPYFRG
ncbi:MAG TPA: hypothetical protein VNQ73_23295 [Ilumatobacter sp.]|nr:hypothetical protein [Ilumatobacter sp.]